MKILFFGAGVLGSLYAARLQAAGHNVTLLARGKRLQDLRTHGLLVDERSTGRMTASPVQTVERLEPQDAYDWVIVLVRKNQLASVLPAIASNRESPNVLFMVNSAAGPEEILQAVERERVLLGFPGAGGSRDGPLVRAHVISGLVQPTTLGELDGRITPRLKAVAAAFRQAGFPTRTSRNMDAWLKTHVAVVTPVANAVYLAGGDNHRLACTPDGLALLVRAVRENLTALQKLDIPITPQRFRALLWLPEPLLVLALRLGMDTGGAELVIARHANAARDEMEQLDREFQVLARRAGMSTPSNDLLRTYIDPAAVPMEKGSRRIALDWSGIWAGLAGAAAALSFVLLLRLRRTH